MRDRKIRIWDNKKKQMHYISSGVNMTVLKYDGEDVKLVFGEDFHDDFSVYSTANIESMDCIGLKDVADKPIYESDVLSWNGWIGGVYWDADFAAWRARNIGSLGGIPNLEIIGNIYENSDFLKEEGAYAQ